ncbi:MAG: LysM peptidoglycan-binding domain-containing protein [Kiritimatiellae bacterium]|nr:LysM peptidoglycan-binding domain-containing protein [Kiritimatiellia bacterium]
MNRTILIATFAAVAACAAAYAQQDTAAARAAYQREQALAEVPRLVQQFDILSQNQDEIAQRLVKLEGADNTGGLRSEIDALRAEIAELRASIRREQDAMRREIVTDLAGRISKLTPPPPASVPVVAPPAAATRPAPPPPPAIGPHYEYVVEKGQTLSYIAQGFDTTVPKILAANPGLKPNVLRVGQKLIIPAEEKPAPKKSQHSHTRPRR